MNPKTVIAIAGLPTSGKTTLGRTLSKATGIHFVDIDDGPASCAPPQEPDPYRSDETRSRERSRMAVAYTILHAAVEANLAQNFPIIISATYSRHISQDFLQTTIERVGGNLKMVLCQYNDAPEEIERRIQDRLAHNNIGGCRSTAHYLDDKQRFAGIKLSHITVAMDDNEDGTNEAVKQVLEYLQQ